MTATALPQDAHSDAVTCKWCGKSFHHLKSHISMGRCEGIPEEAKGLGVDDVVKMYTTAFPGEPTLSPKAIEALKTKRSEKAGADGKIADISAHPGYAGTVEYKTELVAAHELLGLTIKELGTPRGKPLQVTVNINTPYPEFVPEVKAGYVYGDFDLIKDIFMMLEIGIPGYLWGHAGTGKAQPVDTLIPTPRGMVCFGDLKVGDEVFGSNGKPTNVTGIFPQGVKPIYRITFRDGSSTRACGEHLWHILPTHEYKTKNGKTYKQHAKIITTKEMIDLGIKNSGGQYKFKVPLTKAVEWPSREHLIPPYLLGALIGDGYLLGNTPAMSVGTKDIDIKGRIDSLLPDGMRAGNLRSTSENGWQFNIIDCKKFHQNRMMDEIKRLGLNVHSGEKFIPDEYLFDSAENRLALLRGLMDTDGSVRENRTSFSTTSKKLAACMRFLVQSLGGTAIVKDGATARHKSGYYSDINVKMFINPFSADRKSKNWSPSAKNPPSRFITSIEEDGEAECMCIKVNADDELYITEEFIVTHNTSLPTQLCALLNRPVIRSQHTASTEEAHITGQILAREGTTYFEPGLLSLAMKNGWVYLADEYDFAFPQILGIYQPVLEGEPLVIKEATPDWRRVAPHKRFAFIGTGNTNGSGDETGLYQGTNIQNAANFSRFGIVSHVKYMKPGAEVNMLVEAGIIREYAEKMVKFANLVRDGYEQHLISQPIGPRELLLSAKIGMMRGDFAAGIEKSFINKLPSTSAQAAREVVQKIFG